MGLIVGNERNGIPRKVLKKADQVISIPMLGKGLSSVNVAVAAAIILYVAERDFAESDSGPLPFRTATWTSLRLLLPTPASLAHCSSSAWAFGWQRLFLSDPAVFGLATIGRRFWPAEQLALRGKSPCRLPQGATESGRL